MEDFATLVELKARLEWELDADEDRIAQGALESLSEDARFYGRNWIDKASAPRLIHQLVLKAAARWMRNPDGYTQSRAGDETLGWTDRGPEAGEPEFSDRQIKQIRALGNNSGLYSAPLNAWSTKAKTDTGYVPVAGYAGESAFPYFASADEY